MGTQLPPPKKGGTAVPLPTIFGPCLLWSNGWMDQDATWYGGRPRPRQHSVRWGPSSVPKRRTAPRFRLMSGVAKTAGWINMRFAMQVDLGPVHIVLNGEPAPPKRGTALQFSAHVCCSQNRWMDQGATEYGSRASSQATLCSMGTQPPTGRDTAAPPHFLAHFFSGTVAHLGSC